MTGGNGARSGSVVVPAHNEGAIIADSLRRLAATLRTRMRDRVWEIVVVDDGSTDDTAASAVAAAAELDAGVAVRVLQHPVNRGLGAALQTGLAASTGAVVVIADCDLSYHPDHIPELVGALERSGAMVAVASPYMPGGRTLGVPPRIERRSRAANRFLARVSGLELHTLTGMVRAYDGAFVRQLALKSTGDVINVEALYKTQVLRGRVVEVPATLDWRGLETRAGRSRRGSRRVRTKTYQTVASGLLFRPYHAFLAAAAAMTGLGALLGLLALLLAGEQFGLTVLGVMLACTGLLVGSGSLLSLQVKRCFEELYFTQSRVRGLVSREMPAPRQVPVAAEEAGGLVAATHWMPPLSLVSPPAQRAAASTLPDPAAGTLP